jgi:hypothetical protein
MLNENIDINEVEETVKINLFNKPEPERIRAGRPRTVNIVDIKKYQKEYYEKNKEKFKGGVVCEYCNKIYSKSNRIRHMITYHYQLFKDKVKKIVIYNITEKEVVDIFRKDIVTEETLKDMIRIRKTWFKTSDEKEEFIKNLIKSKEHLPENVETTEAYLNLSDNDKSYHKYWYGNIPGPHD